MKKSITKANSVSALSSAQKGELATWLYDVYRDYCVKKNGLPAEQEQHNEIIKRFAVKMKENGIIMPDKQIQLYYNSKQNGLVKRLKKEFPDI